MKANKIELFGNPSRRFTSLGKSAQTFTKVVLAGILGVGALAFLPLQVLAQGSCSNGGSTQISGTVYAPNGTDPLPNILVYIPATTPNAFTDGVSPSNPVIDNATNLVTGSPIVQTTTAANGQFTLTNTPYGTNIPLVIQAGRWRRQFIVSSVTQCQGNPITTVTQGGPSSLGGYGESTTLRFAQTQSEGDIPKMALATGKADALECTLRKVGVADTEFTDYTVDVASGGTGPGRVSLFEGAGDSGVKAGSTTHTEDTLVGSTSSSFSGSLLGSYNILMLPCQGDSTDYTTSDGRSNVISFTGAGGRIFATHHSAFYIDQNSPTDTAATWSSDKSVTDGDATINTAFASGALLAQWLQDIGSTTTSGQVELDNDFNDQTGVNAPTETWATMNSNSDVMQFSFYTPVGASTANQYGRVMFNEYHVDNTTTSSSVTFPNECTGTMAKTQSMSSQEHMLEYSLFDLMNFAVPVTSTNVAISVTPTPSNFTGGDQADTVTVQVTNNGSSAISTAPTVNLTVTLPAGLTPVSMADPLGNWSCNVNTLTCTLLNPLAASTSNSVVLTVSVAANVTAGSASIGATVASTGFVASTTGDITLSVAAAPPGTVTGPLATNISATNVGTTAAGAATVTFAISGGTTVSAVSVVTEGYAGKDFTNANSGTCTAKTYASPTSCTVVVNFTPAYPGLRIGAVQIVGPSNALLDTAYISGIGLGPEISFQPGTQTTAASSSGSNSFSDSAVDIQGNIYLVDFINNRILKETLSGSTYIQTLAVSGLNGPTSIAVDGAGDLYIANTTGGQVLKETLAGGSYTQSIVAAGLSNPDGVAADGAGNIYISDSGNNRILLETSSGSEYTQSTLVSGLNSPSRLAVDLNGNVYIADTVNNRVVEEVYFNGSYTQTVVDANLSDPSGVAVDDNGNVYVADSGNGRVVLDQASNGSFTQSQLVGSLNYPVAVALDQLGNLYITDRRDNELFREDYSDAPSLSFASTVVNNTSSDSPKTVSVQNYGNTGLTLSGLTTATDFPQSTGNPNDCSSSSTIVAAGNCALRISFLPLSTGSLSESYGLTDNSLNVPSAKQSVGVSGTATSGISISLSPASLPNSSVGLAYSENIYATGGTSPYTYSTISGSLPAGLILSSGGLLSGTPTAIGTFTFTVQAQDSTSAGSGGPYTGTQAYSVQISQGTATVSLSNLAQTYTGSPLSVSTVTAPTGLSVSCTYNGLTTAPTAAGSYPVVCTINDANYTGSNSGTLVIAKATATVNLSNLAQTYTGSPLPVTTLTAPTGLSVTCTYNGLTTVPTAAGSYPVVCTINDANYTGSNSGTLVIAKATATVNLSNLAQTYTGSPLPVTTLTAPTGLSVTCTYNGLTTVPTAAGSYPVVCTINDANYTGSNSGTLVISKATATVNLSNLAQTYTGSPLPVTTLTAPTGLSVSCTYNGLTTAPTAAGSYPVVCTINDANYTGSNSGTLVISKATATVNLSNLAQTYTGSPLPVSTVTAPTGLSVSCTYNGLTTAPTAAGSYPVVCTINDPNYTGSNSGTLVISKATATVNLSNLAQTYTGSPLPVTTLTAPTGLSVSCTYNGLTTAPTAAGSYPVVCTINDPNYTGSNSGTLVISKATATVSLSNLAQTYTGSPLPVSTVTAPTGLSVSCTYNGLTTAPTAAGSYPVVCTINDANYTGSNTGTLVISKAQPSISWPTPAAISYGTALTVAQLNASVTGIPGMFTYTPPAGTVLSAGANQSLSVLFTPTDTADYSTATQTASITVGKVTPAVALASSSNPALSQSSVTFTATVSSAAGVPTGTVTFLNGTAPLGSGTVSGGIATFTTATLPTGTQSISASYSGDSNFTPAVSSITSQVVLDFSLTNSPSTSGGGSQTIAPGGSVTDPVTITPTAGTTFPTITYLTVTGLPPGGTVTLNTPGWTQLTSTSWSLPAFASLSDVSFSFHMSAVPVSARLAAPLSNMPRLPAALATLLLLPFARRMRRAGRRFRGMVAILMLAAISAAVAGLSGCGATNGFFAEKPQTYTVTITATTGTLSHSTNITLETE